MACISVSPRVPLRVNPGAMEAGSIIFLVFVPLAVFVALPMMRCPAATISFYGTLLRWIQSAFTFPFRFAYALTKRCWRPQTRGRSDAVAPAQQPETQEEPNTDGVQSSVAIPLLADLPRPSAAARGNK